MYGYDKLFTRNAAPAILTTRYIFVVMGINFSISFLMLLQNILTSENLIATTGIPVGGDFVAFWGSAKAIFADKAVEIYQASKYEAWLEELLPRERGYGLTWQYPPTYYFLVSPLAFLGLLQGYALWTGGSFLAFLVCIRKYFSLPLVGLFFVAAAPLTFNAVITGQNGFVTTLLLLGAAGLSGRRPVIAGICAGLLTMKPQIGLLLPIAFMAAGHWRAFVVAALTALILFLGSIFAFGIEVWEAFFASVLNVGNGMKEAIYPLHKMRTVFAVASVVGVPSDIAMLLQIVSLFCIAGFTFIFWQQVKAPDLRLAFLSAALFFAAPYAYYYEMTLLLPAIIVFILRTRALGWRLIDEGLMVAVFAFPLFQATVPRILSPVLGLSLIAALLIGIVALAREQEGFRIPFKVPFLKMVDVT